MTATTTTAPATATRTYAIDKTHSELVFQVRHLVTRVRGRFTDFDGTVTLDTAVPERSSVNLSINAASIDTSTADRDAHLRSDDFFAVEKYPALTFSSTWVTKKSEELYEVAGTLTIRGVAKDVALPVTFLGAIGKDAVMAEMRRAVAVVVPSVWYEGFPMVVIESFAAATPIVASNLGSLAEIVEHGKTGILTAPRAATLLGQQVTHLLANPFLARRLGEAARNTFLEKYTPHTNLKRLEMIYDQAISERRSH